MYLRVLDVLCDQVLITLLDDPSGDLTVNNRHVIIKVMKMGDYLQKHNQYFRKICV